ncbi:MAG: hypothetical protein ACTHKZ_05520 [Lysobacteraceae bacterium]
MRPTHRILVAALLAVLAACSRNPSASAAAAPVAAARPAAAPADPRAEVQAAMDRFLAARSFHATMRLKGGAQGLAITDADFVAPDRYRITIPNVGTQTVIGGTMYMTTHGHTMRVPMPAGTLAQWRDPARISGNLAAVRVEALGADSLGGAPARKYALHHAQPRPLEVLLWVGEDGRPLQVQVDSRMQGHPVQSSVRYSRYDDPAIAIQAPR